MLLHRGSPIDGFVGKEEPPASRVHGAGVKKPPSIGAIGPYWTDVKDPLYDNKTFRQLAGEHHERLKDFGTDWQTRGALRQFANALQSGSLEEAGGVIGLVKDIYQKPELAAAMEEALATERARRPRKGGLKVAKRHRPRARQRARSKSRSSRSRPKSRSSQCRPKSRPSRSRSKSRTRSKSRSSRSRSSKSRHNSRRKHHTRSSRKRGVKRQRR